MDGELTLAGLTISIEKICTISGVDIRVVLNALVNVTVDSLSDSKIVKLGDLGSLRATISSEGKTTAEETSSAAIKSSSVRFTLEPRIEEMLNTSKYQKE